MPHQLSQLMLSEEYSSLLAAAALASQQASYELLSRFGNNEGIRSKSNSLDLVSDADLAAEMAIMTALRSARPHDSIVSEEGAWEDKLGSAPTEGAADSSGYTWVIDPLDGTVNYLYGSELWSVSIAVRDAEGTVIGVVSEPTRNRQYVAIRGRGAYVNGKRIVANDLDDVTRAMLTFGAAYDPDVRAHQGAVAAYVLPRVRDVRRHGSAALELCRLAAGEIDGYFEDPIYEWDIAAGALIAEEAGAVVTRGPVYEGHQTSIVAATAGIQAALVTLLTHAPQRDEQIS